MRVVDESPVQVFSIAMGLSAVVFPLTFLNFRWAIRLFVSLGKNEGDYCWCEEEEEGKGEGRKGVAVAG